MSQIIALEISLRNVRTFLTVYKTCVLKILEIYFYEIEKYRTLEKSTYLSTAFQYRLL